MHLHKRLSVTEVTEVFERYLSREIGVDHVLALLKIHRRRFFTLLKRYREAPDRFTLASPRRGSGNRLDATAETKIVSERQMEAALIADNGIRLRNRPHSLKDLSVFVKNPASIRLQIGRAHV